MISEHCDKRALFEISVRENQYSYTHALHVLNLLSYGNHLYKIVIHSAPGGDGGRALRSSELRYVRPVRFTFSVPLNICKGIYFMSTACKGAFFNDQRCYFSWGAKPGN